tara:strand:- start:7870 stop:8352 length:483 start_codon:yes stop_codon:yes gene_type:complete
MAKKLTKKQQKELDNYNKYQDAIKDNKIVKIDTDAIINLPILGAFREYIGEALNYIFTLKTDEETVQVMQHIQSNFKNVKKDAPYDGYMNTVWCLMTLMTEINRQAAQQGKMIITDEPLNDKISKIVQAAADKTGKKPEDFKGIIDPTGGEIKLTKTNED